MNTIINNLNISLLDLLSVLLPGATGLYFLNQISILKLGVGDLSDGMGEWERGLIYFGAAYFVGYVIYASSSFLDGWYDAIKRYGLGLDQQNKFLEDDKRNSFLRRLVRWMFPIIKETHTLVMAVVEFKNADIGEHFDGDSKQVINAYQYSFRRLMAEQPAMFAEVERYYATARFFRSMTLVLFFGALVWPIDNENRLLAVWIFLLSVIALFVFINRWRKANHVAYKNVIVLEGLANRTKRQAK